MFVHEVFSATVNVNDHNPLITQITLDQRVGWIGVLHVSLMLITFYLDVLYQRIEA